VQGGEIRVGEGRVGGDALGRVELEHAREQVEG